MKFRFSFGDLYLSLWCLYYLQGTLYDADGIFGKVLFLIIIVISLYYAFFANTHYKLSVYFKALSTLMVMFGIYGIIHIMFGNRLVWLHVPTFYYIKAIYLSFLPIFVFYVLTKQGKFNEGRLKVWIFFFCAVATALYFKKLSSFEGEEGTNNTGYMFLSILPLVAVFNKKPLVQSLIMAYCSFYIIAAMKRGAIFIGIVVLLILVYEMTRHSSDRRKLLSFISVIVLSYGAVTFVQYLLANSDFFVHRIDQTLEGNSSERDIIYSFYYEYFFNQNDIIPFLFGHGADFTVKLFGNYAHNDWLEIAINNGLVGVILFAFYYLTFFNAWRKIPRNTYLKTALGTALLIVFSKTFFSMSYSNTTVFTTCLIGYCMAMKENCNRS